MGTCEICGATENIQKHHVSYEPEIIQLLCVDCHKAVHNHGVGKASGWNSLFEVLRNDAGLLFKEGATNKEVAKACDISYATASHWRKKLGLRGLISKKSQKSLSKIRTINVMFEDAEFKLILEIKEKTSWHNFILENAKKAKAYDEYLAKVESGEIEVVKRT